MQIVTRFTLVSTASIVCAASALAFSSGPPDDYAGNPPFDDTCVLCHSSFPLNSGDGTLTIEGLPEAYDAGVTYDLSVVLDDPGQMRWGFEITAVGPDDNRIGSFAITDATNTQLSDFGDRDFVKQTSEGTFAGTSDGPVSWSFQWTAPAEGTVRFFVAGNAANFDGGTPGDYVYTTDVEVVRNDAVPVRNASWSTIKDLYR